MAKAVKKPRKKTANGYQMPEPLPAGEILTDISKKQWRLGPSIGKGGFGEIYSAQDGSKASSKYPYVVKIEPHDNGPLFVEMHFYVKNAKAADIEDFKKKHKLKTFGMPEYLGSGSHDHGGNKFRFIVMEKFGLDVDKLRENGALPAATVYQLAWQLTYVLEYIHDLGYIHADIKGGNVLLGATSSNKNQAYLLDFGIATKFSTDKVFKPNPKKAHDGTIEYLSRDAHHGVPTRRGDFEIMGYNLITWLGGKLPWQQYLADPKTVQQMKEDSMSEIPKFVKSCLKKNEDTLLNFLQYVDKLKFDEKPDYKKIRAWFEDGIKNNGSSVSAPLVFESAKNGDNSEEGVKKKVVRKKRKSEEGVKQEKDSEPLKEVKDADVQKPIRKRKKKEENGEGNASEEVMTQAMKEVLAKKKEQDEKKKKTKKAKANGEIEESVKKNKEENGVGSASEEVMTEAMKEVLTKKKAQSDKKKKAKANGEIEESVKKREDGRPKRQVPAHNYSEETPKLRKKK